MGAKCSSILVSTPDATILIDPGAAAMQKGYPMSDELKIRYLMNARKRIEEASKMANVIVISHYHHDHFTPFHEQFANPKIIYSNKLILAKDPNQYINESQWERAQIFYAQLFQIFGKVYLDEVLEEPKEKRYKDPMYSLPLSSRRDWKDYSKRKEELIEKGRKWFENLVNKYWLGKKWIPEKKFDNVKVSWIDGRITKFGKTKLKFSEPRFHGLEFDRLGWVISTTITYEGTKLMHTSDLEGVQIDDYSQAIIEENPTILILDGPPTYLFGFMMNKINLNRSIENLCKIIKEVDAKVIILDHHLLRENKYMERIKEVYETAKKENKKVLTAAEYLGMKPKILEITNEK
jgi:hypothetical protein